MKAGTLIAHWFILSCRKASYLIVKKKETRLSTIEGIQLNWHKQVCQYCTAFEVQVDKMDEAIKKGIVDQLKGRQLSDDEKLDLQNEIEHRLK